MSGHMFFLGLPLGWSHQPFTIYNPGTLNLNFAMALLCATLFLQLLDDFSFLLLLLLANIGNIKCMIDNVLSVTEYWGFVC